MKLIIHHDRIAATALDSYEPQGYEQAVLDAPSDFDIAKLQDYRFVGGELVYPAADLNVARARSLLEETDWSDLMSVRSQDTHPHLLNGAEFDTYRAALRSIVVGRPEVVEVWPNRPKAVWSNQS